MSEGGKGKIKTSAIIRIILCVVILITCLLGMFKVVDKTITIPITSVSLIAVSAWNGIEAIREGRKKQAILMFVCIAILIAMLIITFLK